MGHYLSENKLMARRLNGTEEIKKMSKGKFRDFIDRALSKEKIAEIDNSVQLELDNMEQQAEAEAEIHEYYPQDIDFTLSTVNDTLDKASKNDRSDNKPDYSLLPRVFMDQVSYVMMAGAEKYGRYNYTKGHDMTQLLAAAERHLKALQEGEDIDKDCSERIGVDVSHAANVAANMLMLLHQTDLGTITDDRFKLTKK